MSNYIEAFKITMKHEGGYSNHAQDTGGETYRGITQRFHPKWKGWKLLYNIDNLNSKDLQKLDLYVEEFYKEMYWDRFRGDIITDQEIANELFDNSVNIGVHRSVIFLQEALNLLNRNQKDYKDISEDGLLGTNTFRTLKQYLQIDTSGFLVKIMNILQGMHYIKFMKSKPSQEIFARGWLRRVKI